SAEASNRMESTISSSLTSAIAPPVRRTTSSTYGPSAGLPMASDLAMVAGRTGRTTSYPAANAAETGAQPPAELLGDLEAEGLGAFGVVGPDVHVDERPVLVLAGKFGREPVHVVVGA